MESIEIIWRKNQLGIKIISIYWLLKERNSTSQDLTFKLGISQEEDLDSNEASELDNTGSVFSSSIDSDESSSESNSSFNSEESRSGKSLDLSPGSVLYT